MKACPQSLGIIVSDPIERVSERKTTHTNKARYDSIIETLPTRDLVVGGSATHIRAIKPAAAALNAGRAPADLPVAALGRGDDTVVVEVAVAADTPG